MVLEIDLLNSLRLLQKIIHENAKEKGFWQEPRTDFHALFLVISELAECGESLRKHIPPVDEHCPKFYNHEIESADAIIRLLDLAEARGWRVIEALIAKVNYNATRPYMHGKTA